MRHRRRPKALRASPPREILRIGVFLLTWLAAAGAGAATAIWGYGFHLDLGYRVWVAGKKPVEPSAFAVWIENPDVSRIARLDELDASTDGAVWRHSGGMTFVWRQHDLERFDPRFAERAIDYWPGSAVEPERLSALFASPTVTAGTGEQMTVTMMTDTGDQAAFVYGVNGAAVTPQATYWRPDKGTPAAILCFYLTVLASLAATVVTWLVTRVNRPSQI